VADVITTALKLGAVAKLAQNARKAAGRTPARRRVPVVVAGGAGTMLAVKKLRGRSEPVDAVTPAPGGAAPGAKVPA
jgi:hypothetical protein